VKGDCILEGRGPKGLDSWWEDTFKSLAVRKCAVQATSWRKGNPFQLGEMPVGSKGIRSPPENRGNPLCRKLATLSKCRKESLW